jgi:hypothetical protein
MGSLDRLAIQRLASVGVVSGGGGGAPLGAATIWPFVADWAALSTIAGPLRDGDQVIVQSLGTGNSFGLARYDDGDAEWDLQVGWFNSFADMEAFSEPIVTGALAAVEVSASDDETAVRYQYESGWARTAFNQPYVWTLTVTQALTGADPSGIGVLRDGDVGLVAASAGVVELRYKAACTVAAGAGGGTLPRWIPPAAYAAATPTVRAYFVGTESDATLAAQGSAVVETNTGTVGTASGYTRLDAPVTVSGSSVAQLTHETRSGADKLAIMCELRGSSTVGFGVAGILQPSTEGDTQYAWGQIGTATARNWFWNGGAWQQTGAGDSIRGGGAAIPSVTPYFFVAESGDAISDVVTTRVDGAVYSTWRRNADAAVAGTAMTITPIAVGTTAGNSGILDLRYYTYLTW